MLKYFNWFIINTNLTEQVIYENVFVIILSSKNKIVFNLINTHIQNNNNNITHFSFYIKIKKKKLFIKYLL